ncbi:MAG: hypothetical protein LBC95_02130 [Candidatus Nomurabacteria bacterium]|jgi:heme A synthase|nr:hypothetical protein [Candidatus Nomurabacteria bacterium]
MIENPRIPGPKPNLLTDAISLFAWAIGIIAVAVIIYAAIRLIIARGNVDDAKKARRMIIWGMVGLFLALTAGTLASIIIGLFK